MVAAVAIEQGAEMMSLDWRFASLSVVFLTDVIVFAQLCREELRDRRARRRVRRDDAFGLAGVVPFPNPQLTANRSLN
jgi:membrane-anchored protein YejM (alkaline phosphatase superfamily)